MNRCGALPMYDLPGVTADVDRLWACLAEECDADPVRLQPVDLYEHWRGTDVLLSQTCGYPLMQSLPDVAVVGVFTTPIGEGDGSHYRSVIVQSNRNSAGPAAINSWDSLSGCISLSWYLQQSDLAPPSASPLVTGGHRGSLAALNAGDACLASIDAVTFDILGRTEPDLLDGVTVIGRGPLVPCLPLITANASDVPALREVVANVVANPTLQPVLERLSINGFRPLDRDAYGGLSALAVPKFFN